MENPAYFHLSFKARESIKVKPKRKSSGRMTRKINGSTPKKDVSADKSYNWYCKHCFRSFSQRVNMEKHEKSCVKGKPYFLLKFTTK